MDNIAEGFMRGGNKEFCQFLFVSRGSAGELKSQLYRVLDKKYIDKEKFTIILSLIDETISLITGLINYLQDSKTKGLKYN
jgi:four helix bundle protein